MIDTIRLEIRGLTGEEVAQVKTRLESHLIADNATGAIRSEIIRGTLLGSWDSRISVQVRDYEFKIYETEEFKNIGRFKIKDQENSKKLPVKVSCPEYLVIEFSLPKWFEGVNFINSNLKEDYRRLTCFAAWFEVTFQVKPPPVSTWIVKRIDIAYCFSLHSYVHILKYVQAFKNLDFTRRKKPQFYQDSFFCAGSTTTLKGYAKETEFKAHDFKRLYSYCKDVDLCRKIADLTKGLFRFEVEFKTRKLESLNVQTVDDLEKIDWVAEMRKEMFKLIKGGRQGRVFKFTEVLETLKNSDISGSGISVESCAAIWSTMVLEGDKYAKKHYGRMKVNRAVRVFEKLDISVLGLLNEAKVSPILQEVNLMMYEVQNGDKMRREYNQLFKIAA